MCAVIARHRVPQVVAPVRLDRLSSELRAIRRARQVAVEHGRQQPVAPDRRHGAGTDEDLAPPVAGRPDDGARGDLGLEDRGHRLRLVRYPSAAPVELRCVERGHLHHRHPHPAAGMQQLRAQRVGEAADGGFGAAVGRLQRDRAVSEGGADLHDGAAVARGHSTQRRQSTVHGAQVGDFRHPADFLRAQQGNRGEDRHHGVVDPDIDRAELRLYGECRALHRVGIRHVERHRERTPPMALDFGARVVQRLAIAGEQRHIVALSRELTRGGPAYTGARAGDDNYFATVSADEPHSPRTRARRRGSVGD
jgi:hypothetical protein